MHETEHFSVVGLPVELHIDADTTSFCELVLLWVLKVGYQLQVRIELLHRCREKLWFTIVVEHLMLVKFAQIIVQLLLLFRFPFIPVLAHITFPLLHHSFEACISSVILVLSRKEYLLIRIIRNFFSIVPLRLLLLPLSYFSSCHILDDS